MIEKTNRAQEMPELLREQQMQTIAGRHWQLNFRWAQQTQSL